MDTKLRASKVHFEWPVSQVIKVTLLQRWNVGSTQILKDHSPNVGMGEENDQVNILWWLFCSISQVLLTMEAHFIRHGR